MNLTDEERLRWDEYLKRGCNATSFAAELGCNEPNARKYFQRLRTKVLGPSLTDPSDPDKTQRVAELLAKANVDPSSIQRINKAVFRSWGTGIKNADGEFEAHGLYSTSIEVQPRQLDVQYPPPQPAAPTVVQFFPAVHIARKTRTVMVMSDLQAGFLVNQNDGSLETIHDLAALDVALQIVADTQPDELIWIGDFLDLAELSRWPQHKEFHGTTQLAIDEGHRILALTKSAAGSRCKKHVIVGGNHDQRFEQYLMNNAKAVLGLRKAQTAPDSWPVMSMPYMLRLEELGVHYTGQYPGGEYWLADNILACHAPPKRLEYTANIVHGHLHRITTGDATIHTRDGSEKYATYDVGCLCKIGFTSDPKRLMRTETPSDRGRTNFSQGILTLNIWDGPTTRHQAIQTRIDKGAAVYGGSLYTAREALAA